MGPRSMAHYAARVVFCSFCLVVHAIFLQGCGSGSTTTAPPSTTPAPTAAPTAAPTSAPTLAPSPSNELPPAPAPVPGEHAGAQCFVDTTWWWNEVYVTSDVPFGSAVNPYTGNTETLTLDIYMPPGNDPRAKRPVIVLAHGGSFFQGDKTSDLMPDMAKNFAIRGYVAASINYRMGNFLNVLSNPEQLIPVKIAVEDLKAGVRYMRRNAASLRIDPDRIMIGGHSAGSITSLYYAYMPNSPEGNSGSPGFSSAVQGVAIVSGEMKFQAFCANIDPGTLAPSGCALNPEPHVDFTNDIQTGDVPLVQVHGTADKIIPFVNGQAVANRAAAVGLELSFQTIDGADHRGSIVDLLDHTKPYIVPFMQRAAQALNLAEAECPPSIHSAQETVTV